MFNKRLAEKEKFPKTSSLGQAGQYLKIMDK
jgi:hypothetical protein